jgi:hypothetical protein
MQIYMGFAADRTKAVVVHGALKESSFRPF